MLLKLYFILWLLYGFFKKNVLAQYPNRSQVKVLSFSMTGFFGYWDWWQSLAFFCIFDDFWSPASIQFSSVAQLCPNLCDPIDCRTQASLSFTVFRSLLKLMSNQSMMPFNHLIPCCPLILLPSVFPSIRVFSSESVLHIKWPEYWSFSLSISPSSEYSGLISFRIDWLSKGLSRVFSSTTV